MSSMLVNCPYCNAQIPPTTSTQGVGECPRCGEKLPSRTSAAGQTGPAAKPSDQPRQRSNRGVVSGVIAVMVLMAILAAGFAWWTIADRRKRDPRDTAKVEVHAPADLPMLGYMHEDSNILMGFHVAELLEHPQGRDLLANLRFPLANVGLDFIERWTGTPLKDIDHVVIGLKTEWPGLPRTTILIQARKPFDSKLVGQNLNAIGWETLETKKYRLGRLPLLQFGMEGGIWLTDDDHRLVLSAPQLQLKHIPDIPHPNSSHLLPTLLKPLRERPRGTQAWIVGEVEDWEKISGAKLVFSAIGERVSKPIRAVQSFGIWMELGDSLQLTTEFGTTGKEGTDLLEGVLTSWAQGGALFADRPEAKALTEEFTKNLKVETSEKRLKLQTRASGDTVKKALTAEPAAPPEAGKDKKL